MERRIESQASAEQSVQTLRDMNGPDLLRYAEEKGEKPADLFWRLQAHGEHLPPGRMELNDRDLSTAAFLLRTETAVPPEMDNNRSSRNHFNALPDSIPDPNQLDRQSRLADTDFFGATKEERSKYAPAAGGYTRAERMFAGEIAWLDKGKDLTALSAALKEAGKDEAAKKTEKEAQQARQNTTAIESALLTIGQRYADQIAIALQYAESPKKNIDVETAMKLFDAITGSLSAAIDTQYPYGQNEATISLDTPHPKAILERGLATELHSDVTADAPLSTTQEVYAALFELAKALDARTKQGKKGLQAEFAQK